MHHSVIFTKFTDAIDVSRKLLLPYNTNSLELLILMQLRHTSIFESVNIASDVNKATTPKAKGKATYLKAKNTTTFPQHLYRTINVLGSNLQS